MDSIADLRVARAMRRSGDPRWRVERSARSGAMVRVRRGVYMDAAAWKELTDAEQMLRRMTAHSETALSHAPFSHESAAAAWELPIIGGWPARPQLTAAPGSSYRSSTNAQWHLADLGPDEVVAHAGFRVTSLERTALDLAATRPLASGVAAIDAVLFRSQEPDAARERMASMVAARRPFWGARKVDAALRVATGAAETPIESLSMTRFYELGFPAPEQQWEFVVDGKRYRVDFFWPEFGVIGEADGRAKYDDAPADVVWREKVREDRLRSVSRGFARWGWDDAYQGHPLAARLERAGVPRLGR